MARTVATDFLHSMKFQVVVDDGDRGITLSPEGRSEAGFSMVTTPEATVESVEYREGTYIYTRKFPGNPTMNDITFSRGVARRDSTFWDWMRRTLEGSGEYRVDLSIRHFHRDTALVRETPAVNAVNSTEIDIETPARTYLIKQAFPMRHKSAGDLDATASEISIMELDVSFEYFEILEAGTT
jgi:phage tail-like protein